jgi:hypothetical protein
MSARFPRVNLLVVGPTDAIEQVLHLVVGDAVVKDPVVGDSVAGHAAPGGAGCGNNPDSGAQLLMWRPGKPFVLPAPTGTGTMILRDVDTLVHDDQCKLVNWLEQVAGRMQVVSTASASLMPLVNAGAFIQTLYYRLNTIYMDLTDKRLTPGDW